MGLQVADASLFPCGFQQITVLTASTALTVPTSAVVGKARLAFIQSEAQAVRWRDDGTAPTAAIGNRILTTGDGFWYTGDLSTIRFIEETATAKLNVSYYR